VASNQDLDPTSGVKAMNQPPAKPAPANKPGHRQLSSIVFGVLVVASVIGIAVMDFSARNGIWYWLAMVPVFGIASIAFAWYSSRDQGKLRSRLIWRQVLHWLTLALAILLIYLMTRAELVGRGIAGLMALLMFAIVTLLAGVHFDWRLAVLGVILAATFAAGVLMQEFFWLLLIPTAILAVIVIVMRRPKKTPAAGLAAAQSQPALPDDPDPPTPAG
jgi:hypothetical protein